MVALILTLPSLAHADGAWVLWEYTYQRAWILSGAYPNYESCIAAQKERVDLITKNAPLNFLEILTIGKETTIFFHNLFGLMNQFRCIPESIDMRGR
jgi:hypothetical protein